MRCKITEALAVVVIFGGIVSVYGCIRPTDPPPLPLMLGFPGQYPPCVAARARAKGPEVWERQDFNRRIVSGVLVSPINVPCVQRSFSAVELTIAAKNGDPVAILVDVMTRYSGRVSLVCQDIEKIRSDLTKAYRTPSPNPGAPISRVPEAAYILATVEEYCAPTAGGNWERLNMIAYDLGYDAAAGRGILLE